MRTIVLVGFPGSGKSTVGRRLASQLSLPFYDTDSYFESKYRISIPDFFLKYGEDFFRICEKTVLEELLSFSPCVIATGGGLPCQGNVMRLINEAALTVYLKMSPKSLFDRLSHSRKSRPLLKGKTPEELLAYIEEMLPRREFYYSQAVFCVKGESVDVNVLAGMLREFCDGRLGEDCVAPPGIEPESKV